MDELSLLRRARTDIPERTPDEIAQGRAALFRAIEDESPFAIFAQTADTPSPAPTPKPLNRRRRRAVAWTGLSVLGAAALTVTLIGVNVVGVPGVGVGGAEPAAASVLESAATATLQFSDPTVAPGQYLLVQTDGVFLGQGSISADAETTGFLENYHDELYVPADREDDWVWVQCVRTPAQTFGPESEALAKLVADDYAKYDADIIRQFPGGITPSGAFAGYDNGTESTIDYAALPQDPEQLLQKIYDMNEAALPDDQALAWIVATLMRGTVPAEFRAVLYETAALIPGVTITDNEATLNGVAGVAVGRIEPERKTRQDLIIDPATGQFIGERQVLLEGIGDDIPPGTLMASTAVTTTVVDDAPADAALCSSHR